MQQNNLPQEQQVTRARVPRDNEVLGVLEQRVGASRMLVKCLDGKTRNCRIPGKLRRKLWIREGDVVLIKPWEFDKDRGDIIFKYTKAEIDWLKRHGFFKDIENEF